MSTAQVDATDRISPRTEVEAAFVVRAETVITMNGAGVFHDGAVVVEGDRIAAVGAWDTIRPAHRSLPVHGGNCGILVPGLVNAHTHFSEAFMSGVAEGLQLEPWLDSVVRPACRQLTEADAYVGTLLRGSELLLSGVTTVCDMFVHGSPEHYSSLGVPRALTELGMRGVVSFAAAGMGGGQTYARVVSEQSELEARTAGQPLLSFRLGIPTLWSQTQDQLRALVQLAGERSWAIHTHLGETEQELARCNSLGFVDAAEMAAALGMLECPTLAAHGTWLTRAGLELLAGSAHAVVHNPVSNMVLMSGWCHVAELLERDVRVAIGTDGAASNDSQNMLETMKVASLVAKDRLRSSSTLDAATALRLATVDGAQALGLPGLGALVVGGLADMALLGPGASGLGWGVGDPVREVVHASSPRDVRDVWISGRRVVADGHVVTVGRDLLFDRLNAYKSGRERRLRD